MRVIAEELKAAVCLFQTSKIIFLSGEHTPPITGISVKKEGSYYL